MSSLPAPKVSRQNVQPGTPLQAASRAIRYLLIGRPYPVATNGQYGSHEATVMVLSALYAAEGTESAKRLWEKTLRHQDPDLTAAVEGRLARAADPSEIK